MERQSSEKNNQGKYFHINRHSRNFKGNGYKLSSRRFLGSFGWTSVSYDWSMVFGANINQSEVTVVHLHGPRNRFADSLYALHFLEWGIVVLINSGELI